MSSFSCPHLDTEKTYCIMLDTDCIPGRKGCILSSRKYVFAIPAEERVNKRSKSGKKGENSSSRYIQ